MPIDKLADFPALEVANPTATLGGAAGESVADALERVPGELRRRDRAVTADDFRELAAMTPTVEVGRAEVMPRVHIADSSCFPRSPVISPTLTIMANARRTALEAVRS